MLLPPTDLVNTAARLAGYAAKHQLEVACLEEYQQELARLPGQCTVEVYPAGKTQLKGKVGMVQVCGVRSLSSQPVSGGGGGSQRHTITIDSSTQLHGRDRELAEVLRFATSGGIDGFAQGTGIMVIAGKSGMGKTSLLGRAMAALEEDGFQEQADIEVIPLKLHANQAHPLQACHSLLEWVLEKDGEERSSRFCKLEVCLRHTEGSLL